MRGYGKSKGRYRTKKQVLKMLEEGKIFEYRPHKFKYFSGKKLN